MDMRQLAANANRKNQVIISDEFFIYSSGRPAAGIVAAGGTQAANINILADSDFLVEKLTYNADLAGVAQLSGTRIVPNVSVLITNTSSGRQLMNVQFPLTGIFGSGELPFILPRQYLFPATSTVQIQLTSFEAAAVPFITLNFIGRKLYWGPAPAGQQQ
jgi:hypothetical protein